ncbi:F-box protein [Legionella cardiaca]|uniref:F-box protein n=1 Tax=Legionella cardiaca TaxID=1071983 RepID=A0ABY8AUT4_9GAMM|nr:F-box protein [Legionella cardiaca]WED44348.1 F-box protein [Legionella cardiaca]
MKPNIMLLPEEVIVMIFRYFSPRELVILLQVCKLFNYIGSDNSLWKKLVNELDSSSKLLVVKDNATFFKAKFKEKIALLLPSLRPKVICQELSYSDASKITKNIIAILATKEIQLGFFQPHDGESVKGFCSEVVAGFTFANYIFSLYGGEKTLSKVPLIYLFLSNNSEEITKFCAQYPKSIIFIVSNQSSPTSEIINYQGILKYYRVSDYKTKDINLSVIRPLIIQDLKKLAIKALPIVETLNLAHQDDTPCINAEIFSEYPNY